MTVGEPVVGENKKKLINQTHKYFCLKKMIIKNKNSWKDKIYQTVGSELLNYPTPSNLNYAYSFGSIIGFYFVLQILTGALLAMHYIPHSELAFDSIVDIMQNVNNGWLIRYMHMNGASVIFIFFISLAY